MSTDGKNQQKVAVITGSGRIGSIGYTTAEKLASMGFHILLTDINKEVLAEAEKRLRSTCSVEVDCLAADIGIEEGAIAVVDKAVKKWGRIDALVNNAGGGIFGVTVQPFLDHTPESLQETLKINLWTAIWMCRAALPVMVKQKSGSIINIGAESVRNGLWEHAGYNAAKGGVHGMTTGLAREFAPYNIRVNTVAPAATKTRWTTAVETDAHINDFLEKTLSTIPMGRMARPEEMAGTIAFLASDDSTFITGQVISVNGGSSML